jgi:hypothetical protein
MLSDKSAQARQPRLSLPNLRLGNLPNLWKSGIEQGPTQSRVVSPKRFADRSHGQAHLLAHCSAS